MRRLHYALDFLFCVLLAPAIASLVRVLGGNFLAAATDGLIVVCLGARLWDEITPSNRFGLFTGSALYFLLILLVRHYPIPITQITLYTTGITIAVVIFSRMVEWLPGS
jgi:hypothetical protein